ncbi:hypothetical protein Tco_0418942 [Tanacetum coccineum]
MKASCALLPVKIKAVGKGYHRTGNNGNQVNHGANSGLTQQAQAYQAPSTQVPVTYARFEAYTKANDVTLNNLQKNLILIQKGNNKIFKRAKEFQNMMLNINVVMALSTIRVFSLVDHYLLLPPPYVKPEHEDDALVNMPKFALLIKRCLSNKDKLIVDNKTPMNANVDLDLPLEEADVTSFSDDSILRGIESDRDSGEDTTSIDDLPLDNSMILSEYESFTFDDEPGMAEVNVFDEINTSELSYPGIGENVVLDEEEDSFTITTRSFLPFVTYPEVLPTSYSTGSEDKVFKPGIFDNVLKRKSSLTLDVFDPLHPPLMDFNVTKAFSGFSGFWKLHGSKLWKDKAIPTISIDGLQSSLHK